MISFIYFINLVDDQDDQVSLFFELIHNVTLAGSIKVLGSTSRDHIDLIEELRSATLTMYSPSLFFALWMRCVRNTICPFSSV